MLERHGPFWSQRAVSKADLGLSTGKAPALRPISRLSILVSNLLAKHRAEGKFSVGRSEIGSVVLFILGGDFPS